jgi:hypothetical protein
MTMPINISREQNKMMRELVSSRCSTLQNWIASAVEVGEMQQAVSLVKELRNYEAMFHVFIPDAMFAGN